MLIGGTVMLLSGFLISLQENTIERLGSGAEVPIALRQGLLLDAK